MNVTIERKNSHNNGNIVVTVKQAWEMRGRIYNNSNMLVIGISENETVNFSILIKYEPKELS